MVSHLLHLLLLAASLATAHACTVIRESGSNNELNELACLDGAQPVEDAEWRKNGINVSSDRVQINGDRIMFDPVLPEDEGLYSCCDGQTPFPFIIPPYVNQSQPPIMMYQQGTSFTIPCGIFLGPLSLKRSYTVTWQRYVGPSTTFKRVGTCDYDSQVDSPATECITPEYHRINLRDFSLTVYNFTLDKNFTEPKVVYKCRVKQSDGDSRDATTDVAFSYRPARILTPLLHKVVRAGDDVSLEIEFEGHPLTSRGVQWRVNEHILPKNLSSLFHGAENTTVSRLHLANVSAEMTGSVEATVNVYNNSAASSQATLIVIPPILHTSVAPPSDCEGFVPVLTFTIPKPIPSLANDSIQLHLNFVRLDGAGTGSDSSLETFNAVRNASVLAGSTRMDVPMEELSYRVPTWKMYTLRLRLEVLGIVSNKWSPYSTPLCINCDDCIQPPATDVRLQLHFQRRSCDDLDSEAIAQSFAYVLLQKIRNGCPDYLCKDLVLTGSQLSCSSGGNAAQFHAKAVGIGVAEPVEMFLASLKEPLALSINDSVDVIVTLTPAHRQRPGIGPIVGPSGGAGSLFLLVAVVMVVCAVWLCRRKRKSLQPRNGGEERGTLPPPVEMSSHSAFSPYPAPSPPGQLRLITNQHPSLPTRSLSGASTGRAHHPVTVQLQVPVAMRTGLTMSEAGHVAAAQLQSEEEEEEEEDSISVELSNYSSTSDVTDASRPHDLFPSPAHSTRFARNGSVPPGYFYPIPWSPQPSSCCACSCHSSMHRTPPATPHFTPSHLRLSSPIHDQRRLPRWPHPHQSSRLQLPQPLSCPSSPQRTLQRSSFHTRSKSSIPLVPPHMILSQTGAKSVSELATAV